MASAQVSPGGVRSRQDRTLIFIRLAEEHADSARLDEGAAEVAAEAGDFEIAYELQRDAVAAWERATKALLGLLADQALPQPEPEPSSPGRDEPTSASEDAPHAMVASPAVRLPRRRQPRPAAATIPPGETYEPKHRRPRRSWRHRGGEVEPAPEEAEAQALDEVLADYVIDLTRTAPYDEWVVRLAERREELKRAAIESDARARAAAAAVHDASSSPFR